MEKAQKTQLMRFANHVRQGVVEGTFCAKAGHPGGSLSIADTLSYLYNVEMCIDPQNPAWPQREDVYKRQVLYRRAGIHHLAQSV